MKPVACWWCHLWWCHFQYRQHSEKTSLGHFDCCMYPNLYFDLLSIQGRGRPRLTLFAFSLFTFTFSLFTFSLFTFHFLLFAFHFLLFAFLHVAAFPLQVPIRPTTSGQAFHHDASLPFAQPDRPLVFVHVQRMPKRHSKVRILC